MKKYGIPFITLLVGFVLGAIVWPHSQAEFFRLRHPIEARSFTKLEPVSLDCYLMNNLMKMGYLSAFIKTLESDNSISNNLEQAQFRRRQYDRYDTIDWLRYAGPNELYYYTRKYKKGVVEPNQVGLLLIENGSIKKDLGNDW